MPSSSTEILTIKAAIHDLDTEYSVLKNKKRSFKGSQYLDEIKVQINTNRKQRSELKAKLDRLR